jgi:P27 family predicted phage terminase small subunit
LTREKPSKVTPPDWLSKEALDVWRRKLQEVAGLKASEDLLDVLDREMLAIYCDAYVQYQVTARQKKKSIDDIKELQAWSRILAAYADKLGFNPSARARLVKKIADEKDKDKMSQFD